jgi:hypothetical protein
VQALAAPGGVPLRVSDVLPGSTHDLTAARELVLPGARPYLARLPILADSGYDGAGAGVLVPVKKPARGELDTDTKTRNALLRSLRYQGERAFALMSQRWRALQHVMVSPTTIGDITKAVLVLVQFEHKMTSLTLRSQPCPSSSLPIWMIWPAWSAGSSARLARS